MAQTLDDILSEKGITPRGKILLFLIFDGLRNEPIQWRNVDNAKERTSIRRRLAQRGLEELPNILAQLRAAKPEGRDITMFDLLHHFENKTRHLLPRTMFYPGRFEE